MAASLKTLGVTTYDLANGKLQPATGDGEWVRAADIAALVDRLHEDIKRVQANVAQLHGANMELQDQIDSQGQD
jgi:hypothetical protein